MMGDSDNYSKYDLDRLQAELEQERETKEMLEDSVTDLGRTLSDLQERLHCVDGEGNEWKTRYETQVELNGQLTRQIALIHERMEYLRGDPVDRLASIRSYDDMPVDALRQRLKLLTNERSDLKGQLVDCGRMIEEEGKAFHKTNDERRAYQSEIAKLSSTLDANRRQCPPHPRGAPEGTQRPGAASSKGSEQRPECGADLRRGGGGGARGRGRGAGACRKAAAGSRLPRLKH